MVTPPSLFCDTCGAANQPRASYCHACGRPLQGTQPTVYNSATGRLLANVLLKQRYHIIAPTGKGGMGAVYKAEDTQLGNRLVAIKEMSQSGLSPQEVKDAANAFKQEAILLAGLQHPNLPSIFDHFEENGRWYLVMSFIQGETLADYLSQTKAGKLPLNEALQIGMQLCDVLAYLHMQPSPIVFRDLKPSNIMRTASGHIYLIDFGIARHFKPGQAKDTVYYGSMGYASPEQYGQAQTTPRSDIYSLGATLYQLVSGHDPSSTPFRFPPLQSLVPAAPGNLTTLMMQMLELDEDKRPVNILVVKQKLQDIAAPPAAPPPPPIAPTVAALSPNPPAPIAPTPVATPSPYPAGQFGSSQSSTMLNQPPPVPASSPSNRNKPSRQTAAFLAISVLVLAGIVLLLVFARGGGSTGGADYNATATAQAQADADYNATATAQAQAAANLDPYQPAGTLALIDPLSQPSAWDNGSNTDFGGQCQFVNSTYQISQSPPNKFYHCNDKQTYSNFAFEVNMTINQGDCGGLVIRDNSDGSNDYLFQVCQSGNYYFTKYVSLSGSDAVKLTSGSSSAINQGTNQSNVIAVVANGSSFDLYVNGQKIASASDNNNTYSQGFIGLIADAASNQTVVTYQNARVWTI